MIRLLAIATLLVGCAAGSDPAAPGSGGAGGAPPTGAGAGGLGFGGAGGASACKCSPDGRNVLRCDGALEEACGPTEACDPAAPACVEACKAAESSKQSVGCEYWATFMDNMTPDVCFAAFVANTWDAPAHVTVEYDGAALPVEAFARRPTGFGPGLQYLPYDPAAGLAPGDVGILFLSGPSGAVKPPAVACPVPSAVPMGVNLHGTGIGKSFRITADVPVVAYQIAPYGGANSAVTGASLLLPTSAWDTNYIAANAFADAVSATHPSLNVVAMEDGTHVSILPVAAVEGGGGVPAGAANVTLDFFLDRGQHAQITQHAELTGSVVQSDRPIGFMAGHPCMYVPVDAFACDHGEQMVPPVRALGSEYVGVMYRPRMGEPALWRLVGAVDGTKLEWSSDVGGPATLDQGQIATFMSGDPFVVKSQDEDHPFILFTHMTGSAFIEEMKGYGDPDTVISVPPAEYMSRYVFFADPTYPETDLVLVRKREGGAFHDVELDCAGVVSGWQPIGEYEWTRVDLVTGAFQSVAGCGAGRHVIWSDAPFGLWIWGWGSPAVPGTGWVSYGYPGGMNVSPINRVVVEPTPK